MEKEKKLEYFIGEGVKGFYPQTDLAEDSWQKNPLDFLLLGGGGGGLVAKSYPTLAIPYYIPRIGKWFCCCCCFIYATNSWVLIMCQVQVIAVWDKQCLLPALGLMLWHHSLFTVCRISGRVCWIVHYSLEIFEDKSPRQETLPHQGCIQSISSPWCIPHVTGK